TPAAFGERPTGRGGNPDLATGRIDGKRGRCAAREGRTTKPARSATMRQALTRETRPNQISRRIASFRTRSKSR
ncbi:MAG: hypothetical protein M3292_03410, partial [Actinomycetota bacterium]|nr:hypothetical protein [Actinomycetota bacterium]